MPTLNIRIKANDETIEIPKELKAQKLELVRCTIFKNATQGQVYNGTLYFNLDLFNGYEVVTNQNDNFLMAPISDEANQSLQTYTMSQSFFSESVRQEFNIKTFFRTLAGAYTPVPFDNSGTDAGKIIYIDLFFQVSQLHDYD